MLAATQPALPAEKKAAKGKATERKEQPKGGPKGAPKGPGKGGGKGGKGGGKSLPKKPICLFYLEGTCTKGIACPARHLSKQEKKDMASKSCHMFAKGDCRFGNACLYSHAKPAAAAAEPKSKAKARAPGPQVLQRFRKHAGHWFRQLRRPPFPLVTVMDVYGFVIQVALMI